MGTIPRVPLIGPIPPGVVAAAAAGRWGLCQMAKYPAVQFLIMPPRCSSSHLSIR